MSPVVVTLALTGASGMPYGIRLLECLLAAGARVYLLYSQAAQIVAREEMELALPGRPRDAEAFFAQRFNAQPGQLRAFGREEWFAPVASGSNPSDAMVVCPCTMGTLAAIAQKLPELPAGAKVLGFNYDTGERYLSVEGFLPA